jgi:hypothetical protein
MLPGRRARSAPSQRGVNAISIPARLHTKTLLNPVMR